MSTTLNLTRKDLAIWLGHAFRISRPVPREPSEYDNLPAALYHLRQVSKLSLNEMGERLGITGGNIAGVEGNIRGGGFSLATLEAMKKMAKDFALPHMVLYINTLMIRVRTQKTSGNPTGRPRSTRIGDF